MTVSEINEFFDLLKPIRELLVMLIGPVWIVLILEAYSGADIPLSWRTYFAGVLVILILRP